MKEIMTGDVKPMPETYDSFLARKAQEDYCNREGVPHFAPMDGRCYFCGRDIYSAVVSPDGKVTGIPVSSAASRLITGCPFCWHTFCD